MRTVLPGGMLEAPGILRNPVPIEAMYDQDVSFDVTLRNLLQRKGFEGIEDIVDQTMDKACDEVREGIRTLLDARGMRLTSDQDRTVNACTEHKQLLEWHRRAVVATSTDDVFADGAIGQRRRRDHWDGCGRCQVHRGHAAGTCAYWQNRRVSILRSCLRQS